MDPKKIDELERIAYDQGHSDGFKAGKEQRDHDIKRAIKEMQKKVVTIGGMEEILIDDVIKLLKKYTEQPPQDLNEPCSECGKIGGRHDPFCRFTTESWETGRGED